jgi:hypothetical protein
LLEKLIWMKGKIFSTLSQNKKFTIEVLDDAGIVVRFHNTGINRTIGWSEIVKAWDYLQQHGTITQT